MGAQGNFASVTQILIFEIENDLSYFKIDKKISIKNIEKVDKTGTW